MPQRGGRGISVHLVLRLQECQMLLGLVGTSVGHQETEVESGKGFTFDYHMVWWLTARSSWCYGLNLFPVFCLDLPLLTSGCPMRAAVAGGVYPPPTPAQTTYLWCLEDYSVHSDFIGVTGEIKMNDNLSFSQPAQSPAGKTCHVCKATQNIPEGL